MWVVTTESDQVAWCTCKENWTYSIRTMTIKQFPICLSMCLFRIAHLLTWGFDRSEHISGTTNQTHHWTNNGCITYGSESESPGSVILNVNLGKSLNLSQYLFFIYKSGVNDPCLKGFWWWIIEIIYLYLVSNFSASFIACNEDDENRFSQCFRVTEFLKA